jgi:hypothetical protein
VSRKEFFEELRSLLKNGKIDVMTQTAVNRLMLSILADLYDSIEESNKTILAGKRISEENKEKLDVIEKRIGVVEKQTLVAVYTRQFVKRPYLTVVITVFVVTYIIVFGIHVWGEFLAIFTPILDFLSNILV